MTAEIQLERIREIKMPTAILAGALSPDETSIAAACFDGVYRTALNDEADPQKLYVHQSYASGVEWPRENLIVSSGYDGQLRWHDTAKNETERELKVHDFWSWDLAMSPDRKLVASVTGQYLAGGYKYEPLPEREPSLCVVSVESQEIVHRLPHIPSVQAVAFSPDSRYVAAGNLMGDVRVYDIASGDCVSNWNTPAFTSWGIIKSHCYLGGIFAMAFTADQKHLLMAGMGPMRDPMAGNGKQLWQKWAWNSATPEKADETHDGESGEGLMEALAVHPDGTLFAMGGRLRGGDWNVALFSNEDGKRLSSLKTGFRVTSLLFSSDGSRLIVLGAVGQAKPNKEGKFRDFGRIEVYSVTSA